MAIVVASLLFGYLAVPYITVYPTRWAVDRLSRANAGEFALGVIAIVIGLLMGLLVGVPLSNLGGAVGAVLPVAVAIILALVVHAVGNPLQAGRADTRAGRRVPGCALPIRPCRRW